MAYLKKRSTISAESPLDYEVGTWTPAMVGSSGSAGSWNMGGIEGDYIRMGKLVYISMYCYVADKGSYSGNLKITGLPFANTGFANVTSLSHAAQPANNSTAYGAAIPGGQSFLRFYGGNSMETVLTVADTQVNHSVSVSGFYHLA